MSNISMEVDGVYHPKDMSEKYNIYRKPIPMK
jgi:hypothetical protein